MGILYIVPTPIGNLNDITLRALDVLKSVKLIAAEDTRETRKLLEHFAIDTPLISYHEHNELTKIDVILTHLISEDVALVTDAGTPGLSDPGHKLIKKSLDNNIQVVSLPGPTALTTALVASGLPTDAFVFLGFIGKKSSQRQRLLTDFCESRLTLVLYESPHRLVETLKDILYILKDRRICIAREITKKFETYYRLNVSQAIELFSKEAPLGEIVVVIEGNTNPDSWNDLKVLEAVIAQTNSGKSLSEATKIVARLARWRKKQVYELALKNKQ